MEKWDSYDRNGLKLDLELIRGEVIPEGYYHLVIEAIIRHVDGDFLLMQRDYCKTCPGQFECSAGGSALKGETSLEAIKREILEETGLVPHKIELLNHYIYDEDHCLFDCYLAIVDSPKEKKYFKKMRQLVINGLMK